MAFYMSKTYKDNRYIPRFDYEILRKGGKHDKKLNKRNKGKYYVEDDWEESVSSVPVKGRGYEG